VKILDLPGLPPKGDIVEWIKAGGTKSKLLRLAKKAKTWQGRVEKPARIGAKGEPDVIRPADVKPQAVEWLWANRIAVGKLTLLVGDPGVGKSFLTLDMAARVSSGKPWPDSGRRQKRGSVILLSAKDDLQDTIRPRLDAAGADVSRVVAVKSMDSLRKDLETLDEAVRETGNVRLVVIDPLTAYLGGVDSHKNAEVRSVLAPLAEMAASYRVAVVGVSHLNKATGGSAIYRTMGSLGFVAAAQAVWMAVKDREAEGRRLFLPAKANLSAEATGMAYKIVPSADPKVGLVEWEKDTIRVDVNELLTAEAEGRIGWGREREEAREWLTEVLKDGKIKVSEVKTLAISEGHSWRTLRRAAESLAVRKSREGFGKGSTCYWSLP